MPRSTAPPAIGVSMAWADWEKARPRLPPPTFAGEVQSADGPKVYASWNLSAPIDGAKPWRWLGRLRLALERAIGVPFRREDGAAGEPIGLGHHWSLGELSDALQPPRIEYPAWLWPQGKEDFYRNLCRYGAKLQRRGILTREELIAASLSFWARLPKEERLRFKGDRWQVCHKKAFAAYDFIQRCEIEPTATPEAIKEARSRGGRARVSQRRKNAQNRRERVAQLREEGLTQKEIARLLGVGIATVKRDYAALDASTA